MGQQQSENQRVKAIIKNSSIVSTLEFLFATKTTWHR